jgi:transposase
VAGQALRAAAPEVTTAWWLKERFAEIYDARDRHIAELLRTWRTLEWWREQILNHFDDRVTNKVKVIKRRSYGFRNPDSYRRKVLMGCRHWSHSGGPTHRIS